MANFPVGRTSTGIFPDGRQGPVTLYNTGVNIVYVSESVNATDGYPLSPGSTLVWDAGRKLFATTGQAGVGSINVTDNGGSVFDASAVAGQILSQGLAGQIAASIFESGVPLVDKPTTLFAGSFGSPTVIPAGSSVPINGGFDVSKLQNVTICSTYFSFPPVTANTDVVEVQVTFFTEVDPGVYVALSSTKYSVWRADFSLTVPVEGVHMRVNVTNYATTPLTTVFFIAGGTREVMKAKVAQPSIETSLGWRGDLDNGFISRVTPIPYGGRAYIPVREGLVKAFFQSTALPTQSYILFVHDSITNEPLAYMAVPGVGALTGFQAYTEFYLPGRPCYLLVSNAFGAPNTTTITATFTYVE